MELTRQQYELAPCPAKINWKCWRYPKGKEILMEGIMNCYAEEELEEALQIIVSIISRCEKIHPKFIEDSSQHTLLKNRIKALYISKSFIMQDEALNRYTKEELTKALKPISSIISKCEKAQLKFKEGNYHHNRFEKIIKAMSISKSLIEDEIGKNFAISY